MNELNNCIVIFDKRINDYVDKSKDIVWIETDTVYRKYKIKFSNGTSYGYNMSSVRWMSNPKSLSISSYLIYSCGKKLNNIKEILRFGDGSTDDWIKILFQNGNIASYPLRKLKVVKDRTQDDDVKNFIAYLKKVATIIKDFPQDDKDFFQRELDKLNISAESILSKIIANEPIKSNKVSGEMIFPFTANASQIKAVKNALEYDISCIQGPPGTGKTQTILNLLANLLYRDLKVAIVAGNNEATRNVQEKLAKEGLKGIDAYLGNSDNIKQFFSEERLPPELGEIQDSKGYKEPLNLLAERALLIYDYRLKRAELQHSIAEYCTEQDINNKIYNRKKHVVCKPLQNYHSSSGQILKLLSYLEIIAQKGRAGFFQKVKLLIKFKITKSKQILNEVNESIDFLQNQYYKIKLQELWEEWDRITAFLTQNDSEKILNLYREQSMYFFKQHMREYYAEISGLSVDQQDMLNHFEKISRRYPIIYSTTHALHYCSGDYLYDYVIMDESSQVDLISAVLAMSCARRIVFVGDQKQLPHVVQSNNLSPIEELFAKFSLPAYLNYAKHSILQTILEQYKKNLPNVFLNEHYRCDPQIIEFCNKRFYQGKLVVQTKHSEGNGITLITTEPHFARGRVNERQADIIVQEILPKLQGKEVGVVAPYRKQVELIEEKVHDNKILVDTVHKFQGKERDVMVLSTVSDKVRFYDDEQKVDFLNNENLINVAISRAKSKLFVIASKEILSQEGSLLKDLYRYVSYYCGQGEIKESKVYSVFDLMYEAYSPVLEEMKKRLLRISDQQSENIIATVIDDICKTEHYGAISFKHNYPLRKMIHTEYLNDIEDRKFAENPNTHCDFLIFNKLDKSILLVVEVDGNQHNDPIQEQRDERKDRILNLYDIPVLRLRTTEIDCEMKIKAALRMAAV